MSYLTLVENLHLLSYNDQSFYSVQFSRDYYYSIFGAIILELALRQKVTFERSGERIYIINKDAIPLGDPILDEVFMEIAQYEKYRTIRKWLHHFDSRCIAIEKQLAYSLYQKGYLKPEEAKPIKKLFTGARDYGIIKAETIENIFSLLVYNESATEYFNSYSYCLKALIQFSGLMDSVPNTGFIQHSALLTSENAFKINTTLQAVVIHIGQAIAVMAEKKERTENSNSGC